MSEENKNVSFWQKNWFACLCFVLCFPIGLFILYTTRDDYPTRWKIGAGLSLLAIVYWLTTGELVNNSIVVSLLTFVILAAIGILSDNIRRYWSAKNSDDETRLKKNIKVDLIAFAVIFVIFGIFNPSDEELEENERISSMSAGEKEIYEKTFAEYIKSTDENDARTKAIAAVDAYNTANENNSKADELEKRRIEINAEKTDHLDNMVNINTLQIQNEVVDDISQKLEGYAWFSFRANMKEDLARGLLAIWDTVPVVITSLIAATIAIETKDIGRFVLLTGMVSVMVNMGSAILFYVGVMLKSLKTYRKLTDEMKYDHSYR